MKKMFYVSCALVMFTALFGCSRLRPVDGEVKEEVVSLAAGSNETEEANIYVYVKDLMSVTSMATATGELINKDRATVTGERITPRSSMLFFLPLLQDSARAKLILFEEGQECAANFDIKSVKNVYLRLTADEHAEFVMDSCIVKAKVGEAGAMAFITQIPAFASVSYIMNKKPFLDVDVDAISITAPIVPKDPYGNDAASVGISTSTRR